MTAVNFPSSPSNGDTLTSGNTTYTYNSTKTRWDAVTTVNGIQLNSLSVGAEAAASGDGGIAYDNTSGEFTYTPPVTGGGLPTQTDNSGKYLTTDGTDASWATVSAGVTIYTNIADLPLSGVPAGAQAYVSATNRLYLWNGTGWYNIALINTAPTITTGGDSSYTLASDGTATVVTLDANDPEGIPITWSYAVTTGALGSTATVSQNNNVFTITPSTASGDAGSFTLTFTASDGVNLATSASEFSLAFEPSWSFPVEQQILQHTWSGYGVANARNDYFGHSVAMSNDGNTAIAGAYGEDAPGGYAGAAYIFTRSGTTWTELAELKALNAEGSDYFGLSVDMSGDGNTAIVGAQRASDSGAAYIFTRSGPTWTQQAMLKASDPQTNDFFGRAVAISDDGNTVVVGAFYEDTGANDAGSAYIFARSGSTWSQQAKIQATTPQALAVFGTFVSISGDGNTVIVGAPKEDAPGDGEDGFVYIFARSGSTWSQQARLTTPGGESYAYFGSSVALSSNGNTAIVGAEGGIGPGGEYSAGAAHIFTRSGTTWTHEARIQASDVVRNNNFGQSVSMSNDGNTVIVGDLDNDTVGLNAGAVYFFTRDGTTWTELSMVQASDVVERQNDGNELRFGSSVALSGDALTAIAGAKSSDLGATDRGAAYILVAG